MSAASFPQDISELKKIFVAGGAIASIIVATIQKKNIIGVIFEKVPSLLPLKDLKLPEILPEVLDLQNAECKMLVDAFYQGLVG